jgi:hypothetical protein
LPPVLREVDIEENLGASVDPALAFTDSKGRRVRLSKRGRQRIVKGRRSRARIVVTTRKADGTTSVATQDLTIRAPAKRKARRR